VVLISYDTWHAKVAGSTPVLTIILPGNGIGIILGDVVMIEENFSQRYIKIAILGMARSLGAKASPRGVCLGSFSPTPSRVRPHYSRLFVQRPQNLVGLQWENLEGQTTFALMH
jgi:hypothetical protein